MQNPIRRGVATLLASLALAGAGDLATAQPEAPPQPLNPYGQPEPKPPTLIDVTFTGGSVADFIAAVKKAAAPTPVNVLIPDPAVAAEHRMAALTFRQVSVENALDAIEWAAGADEPGQYNVSGRQQGGGEPIYIVAFRGPKFIPTTPAAAPPSPPAIRVFMIRDLIEPEPGTPADATTVMSAESLLGAVDAVLASLPEGAAEPTVRFHPESATLIVSAPTRQLDAIQSMLMDIRQDIERRRDSLLHSRARTEDAQMRARRADVELGQLRKALEMSERQMQIAAERLDRMQQARDAGTISRDQLNEGEMMLQQAEAQLAEVQGQIQMTEMERQSAQEDLEAARRGTAQLPAAAEAIPVSYEDRIVAHARSEVIAVIEAVRNATHAGGLPTINTNTPERLVVTATEAQHAILRAAIEAMNAAAQPPEGRQRNNRRE